MSLIWNHLSTPSLGSYGTFRRREMKKRFLMKTRALLETDSTQLRPKQNAGELQTSRKQRRNFSSSSSCVFFNSSHWIPKPRLAKSMGQGGLIGIKQELNTLDFKDAIKVSQPFMLRWKDLLRRCPTYMTYILPLYIQRQTALIWLK